MADITINGKDLTFDLRKLSMREYRKFASGSLLDPEDDQVLAKLTGEPADFFADLPQPDHRKVVRAYFDKASKPVENDPNV